MMRIETGECDHSWHAFHGSAAAMRGTRAAAISRATKRGWRK